MVHKAAYDVNHEKGVKILTRKQMLKRLPVALTQVKAGNTSEKLLNEIIQIIHSLHHEKEFTKKVYGNLISFMNFKNSKTSDPHRLFINLENKINLKRPINMLLYQISAYTIHGKI